MHGNFRYMYLKFWAEGVCYTAWTKVELCLFK